jgi:hypothetical protein
MLMANIRNRTLSFPASRFLALWTPEEDDLKPYTGTMGGRCPRIQAPLVAGVWGGQGPFPGRLAFALRRLPVCPEERRTIRNGRSVSLGAQPLSA